MLSFAFYALKRWGPPTYRKRSCGATTSETVWILWRVRYSNKYSQIIEIGKRLFLFSPGLVCCRPFSSFQRDRRHHPASLSGRAQSRRNGGWKDRFRKKAVLSHKQWNQIDARLRFWKAKTPFSNVEIKLVEKKQRQLKELNLKILLQWSKFIIF